MKIIKTFLIILILTISNVSFCQFEFDSTQVKKIRLIIEENKFLQTENDSLNSRVAIYKKSENFYKQITAMQDTIIGNKEKQIRQLEAKPQQVIQINQTKWYTWAGVIISSVCAGIITGLIIK